MIAGFYQLARRPVEAVLPSLVVRALGAGHRLLVRCEDEAVLEMLDERLWSFSATSFLPHGREAVLPPERAATQPVLLGRTLPAVNGADCLVQVHGDVPEEVEGLARLLYLFGEADLAAARGHWRRLKGLAGVQPVFWRESEAGGFEKVA